jgi:D-sedoheptulose 7-phosphate isomerase|tara:strand:+ start:4056 stop:4637 length:582 start_codon:yes stop_codon:yes gene_type:complete
MISLQKKIKYHSLAIEEILKQNSEIKKIIDLLVKKITHGGKVFFCGNGGSCSDAQHLAAEMLIRLKPKNNRKPMPAISLATDTSTLTACGNDYDFNEIFSRPFEALSEKKDILFIISTSGNSQNIVNVLKKAKKKGITSIGFLGKNGGKCKILCKNKIIVSSNNTAIIQECHIFLGHFIIEEVEKILLEKKII